MNAKDPFGNACLAFLEGKRGEEIKVFCDISEEDIIPVDYLFRVYDEMPEIEQVALKHCSGKVLDVGAGTGCHTLWLQKKGLETYAMDFSEGAIKTMENRGVKNVLYSDFFSCQEEQKFDTLLFLMNGIGIAKTLDGLSFFFEKCLSLLRDDGQIILDSTDLIYLVDDEENGMEKDGYLGEVEYKMKYRESETEWFPWLYIDKLRLKKVCDMMNLKMEIIKEGGNHNFLVKIKK